MSPLDIEPAVLCFLVEHLAIDRLAIETVDYLWFKLLQYSVMRGASPNTLQYNLSKC